MFFRTLENEVSLQTVYHYYSWMASYRNAREILLVLMGTQDAISSTNPKVIDDIRVRKPSNDLKWYMYYEMCATHGLKVERVFQDIDQKIVATRSYFFSVPSTPSTSQKELWLDVPSTANNPMPNHKQSKCRSNLFTSWIWSDPEREKKRPGESRGQHGEQQSHPS